MSRLSIKKENLKVILKERHTFPKDKEDYLIWTGAKFGLYSAKEGYKSISSQI